MSIVGDKEPTSQAIERIRAALQRLRRINFAKEGKRATVIFSKRFENGQWYYYNLKTAMEWKPVKDRLIKNIEGTQQTILATEEVLNVSEKEQKEKKKWKNI